MVRVAIGIVEATAGFDIFERVPLFLNRFGSSRPVFAKRILTIQSSELRLAALLPGEGAPHCKGS